MTDEDRIQMAVVEYLRLRKYLFWHTPNGGRATPAWRKKQKALGQLAGAPDIAIVLPGGQAAFMEIKTATGTLSAAQKDFRDVATKLGAKWSVVRSVDEAAVALELWA